MVKAKHESEEGIYQVGPWASSRIYMKDQFIFCSTTSIWKGTYEATKFASLLATPFKVG